MLISLIVVIAFVAICVYVVSSNSQKEIPQGVCEISMWEYRNARKIVIPKSVKNIGIETFKGCTSLKCIDGDLSGIVYIGCSAFAGCSSLVVVSDGILSSVSMVGSSAFEGTAIHSISMPHVKYLGDGNFRHCSGNTFADCRNLKEVVLSTKIQKIENMLFKGCVSLDSLSFYCEEEDKYYSTNEKGSVVIPDCIKEIKSSAFQGCNSIRKLRLPSNISLGFRCFADCKNLRELYVSGTTEINSTVIERCPKVKIIQY